MLIEWQLFCRGIDVNLTSSQFIVFDRSRPVLRLQIRLEQSSPTIPLNCTLKSDETW